ncbi:MAG: GNAT family N-acetyltransferase [bacterium]|nr:MAG: GNAT family N-acetyltransferase [bacterium]
MNAYNVSIREATDSDSGLIAAFGARTFEDSFGFFNKQEDMEEYLSSHFSEESIRSQLADGLSTFLLAFEDDQVVGYSMLYAGNHPDSIIGSNPVELVRIYVDRHRIGKGYGSKLMEVCLQKAKISGHDKIWLGVWEKNVKAITFYEKWGFKRIGMKEFVIGSDVQHDFIMERSTNQAA